MMKNTLINKPRLGLTLVALALASSLAVAQQAAPAGQGAQQGQQGQQRQGGGIGYEKAFPKIESGKWTGPRLADGQPDVSGHWSNTIANHNNFTDPQGGIPSDQAAKPPKTKREERAPSRVSDPVDGQVPFQAWAAAAVKDFQANFNKATLPQHVEPLARCAPSGVPKSLYWHGYEIRQFPGYVLFLFNSGYRLIHLDDKPHLPENIKLWNADSRGRWEGNTLVVDVKNHNGKALFGRSGEFISANGRITERYIFSPDNKRYNYEAVVTDPTVYTKPWSITIPARRYTEADKINGWHYETAVANHDGKDLLHERYERICVENNGSFGDPTNDTNLKK